MNNSKLYIDHKTDGTVQINIVDLGIAFKRRGNAWTVFCPSFKVLGFSKKSKKDALKDFEQNLTVFFGIHLDENSLYGILESLSWNRRSGNGIEAVNKESIGPGLVPQDFELAIAA
ncbi:MAG: hypothetical protein AAF348_17890 [Bacteroidota bacterium]